MDNTKIGNRNVILKQEKIANIIQNIDYDKLSAVVDKPEKHDEGHEKHHVLQKEDLIDKRKEKLTMMLEPGILSTVDLTSSKGYLPSASNFPPYPSESGAPSVLPSGTWRSTF